MSVVETVLSGSLLVAVPIAMLAGLVSFFSPCVLPLLPGYLAYAAGLSSTEIAAAVPLSAGSAAAATAAGRRAAPPVLTPDDAPKAALPSAGSPRAATAAPRARLLAGSMLFVLGFSAVFVTYGAIFGGLGGWLLVHQRPITIALGVVTIGLGVLFGGWIPAASLEWRRHTAPRIGLAGAPLLGVTFGLGWTACIGPTLAAVIVLAVSDDQASALRGAVLSFAYCLGLGIPFVVSALAYARVVTAAGWARRHQRAVMRLGGGLLILLGLLLVSGLWGRVVAQVQVWVGSFVPAV